MGIEHRGDEVMSHLGQQWNGLPGNTGDPGPRTADANHTPEIVSPRDKTGGAVSSTPFKAGSHDLPPLSESPVPVSQR